MILDLIKYKTEELGLKLIDNKIEFIYEELFNRIVALEDKVIEKANEKPKEKVRPTWKGFGNPEEK